MAKFNEYGQALDEHGNPMLGWKKMPGYQNNLIGPNGEREGYWTTEVGYTGPTYDESGWGGVGPDVKDGYAVPGSSGFDKDVRRHREMGADAYGRTAPTIDRTQADQARGWGAEAIGMMRQRALGQGPSAAEIAGRRMIDDQNAMTMGQAASARGGPGAQALAMRSAQFASAQNQQAGLRQMAELRAREMAEAQRDLYGASSGMRGQDIGLAVSQAEQEGRQRALNAQERQAYERMAFDVRKAEQDRYAIKSGNYTKDRANKLKEEEQDPGNAAFWW